MTKQEYLSAIKSQCVQVALDAVSDSLAQKLVELDAANAKISELEAKTGPVAETKTP